MKYKKSSDLERIFLVNRDFIRTLVEDKVLKPEIRGPGIASRFGLEEIYRLTDIRIYMDAGFGPADMKRIYNSEKDSEEGIDEQISNYKRKIRVLEFLKALQKYNKGLNDLSFNQLDDIVELNDGKNSLPKYGTDEFLDVYCDIIELAFKIDYLCQKKSLDDTNTSFCYMYVVYDLYREVSRYLAIKIDQEIVRKIFKDIEVITREDEKEIINELAVWFSENEYYIIGTVMSQDYNQKIDKLDEQSGSVQRDFLLQALRFVYGYLCDENSLYCIYRNLKLFASHLNKEALDNGEIKLIENEIAKPKKK